MLHSLNLCYILCVAESTIIGDDDWEGPHFKQTLLQPANEPKLRVGAGVKYSHKFPTVIMARLS